MSLLSLHHLLLGVSISLGVKCKCLTRSLLPYQALSDSPLHLPFTHYPLAIRVCFLSLKHGMSFPSHDLCGCSYFCLNCSSPYFQMSPPSHHSSFNSSVINWARPSQKQPRVSFHVSHLTFSTEPVSIWNLPMGYSTSLLSTSSQWDIQVNLHLTFFDRF